jgi:putative SOS response-associated peptidase YedK
VARLAQAERERLSAAWACVSGAVGMTLPDDPTAIGCYFLTALTPVVGETKDLTVEAVKSFSGLSPDWVTVGLAGVGLGSLALGPASLPARYAVATVKTARRIGGLSARLAGEIAESARAAARFDRAAGPADWIDLAALRPLVEPARAIGEVAIDAGPVAAVRAMRHVDTLTDAPRLARVSAATAAKPGPALEALGLGRIFRPVSRLSRAAVEVWGLAAAALAQLGLAALSLAQWGAGRALRPDDRRAPEMCGRFALTTPQSAVAEHFAATPRDGLPETPRYNICPTQPVGVVRLDDGARVLEPMRWGFVPPWAKALDAGPLLINARSETIAEKPTFRAAARKTRCLIPASGFYEWARSESGKDPWWVHPAAGDLIAYAGVWSEWAGPDGPLRSCAIVTCPANGPLSTVHHRMPVVIHPEGYGLWLGEEGHGAATLMKPAADDFFAMHRVSRAVNGARDDRPELMAPLEA